MFGIRIQKGQSAQAYSETAILGDIWELAGIGLFLGFTCAWGANFASGGLIPVDRATVLVRTASYFYGSRDSVYGAGKMR